MASAVVRERERGRSRPRAFSPPSRRIVPSRPPPQLTLRIAILGGVLLVAFAALFLRLWALQVLSGSQYLHAAQNNQLRTLRVPAPRGPILDRNGVVLVGNAVGTSVQVWPADLPEARSERLAVLRALAQVVRVPLPRLLREVERADPLAPVTVRRGVHDDRVFYLAERQNEFPGVTVTRTPIRSYPFKALAAHVLGHVGEVSAAQLEDRPDLAPGDDIGQGGVEAAYDAFVRGRAGTARLRVDSAGRARSNLLLTAQPQPGHALRLTLDWRLQQAAERALRFGIELARGSDCYGCWSANGGAVVALDPRTGEVLALASYPTYRPSILAGRVHPRNLAAAGLDPRTAGAKNYPAVNRAIAGRYPPGSTFKPVTALAAIEERLLSPREVLACTPSFTAYKQVFRNWNPYVNMGMTLPAALAHSCDTYFYELGLRFYHLPAERGPALQAWARRFGFGVPAGIDVAGEDAGLLPTPAWRRKAFRGPRWTSLDRDWKPGDSIQLAIGQKDLVVTPLQMARFYALIANGGHLVTPHLVSAVERPRQNGQSAEALRRFAPPPPRATGVDPSALAAVRAGLYEATHAAFGTSSGVFGSFPVPVAGKTGTAEKIVEGTLRDQSWWCGYAPADKPTIVVCALVENGGHGGSAAAPAALKVFEQYFGRTAGVVTAQETD